MSYANVRCFQCKVGTEQAVIEKLEKSDQAQAIVKAISPLKKKKIVRRGQWSVVEHALLPGYVFVYGAQNYPAQVVTSQENVFRLLHYSDDLEGYLHGKDADFAKWIWKQAGVIDILSAVSEGSTIRIVDGLLANSKATVLKVDKRKQCVKVALDLIGSVQAIWLSYDCLTNAT